MLEGILRVDFYDNKENTYLAKKFIQTILSCYLMVGMDLKF